MSQLHVLSRDLQNTQKYSCYPFSVNWLTAHLTFFYFVTAELMWRNIREVTKQWGSKWEKTGFGKISKVFELTAASCVSRLYCEGGCQPGTNRGICNRCVYLALARRILQVPLRPLRSHFSRLKGNAESVRSVHFRNLCLHHTGRQEASSSYTE